MCEEGSPRKDLTCPQCHKHDTVTVLNDSVYQCCGARGGCGFVTLKKEEFITYEQRLG